MCVRVTMCVTVCVCDCAVRRAHTQANIDVIINAHRCANDARAHALRTCINHVTTVVYSLRVLGNTCLSYKPPRPLDTSLTCCSVPLMYRYVRRMRVDMRVHTCVHMSTHRHCNYIHLISWYLHSLIYLFISESGCCCHA